MGNSLLWAGILFIIFLVGLCSYIVGFNYGVQSILTGSLSDVSNDDWWHKGYKDCSRNFNLTSDEIRILNEYRITKIVGSK